MEKTKIHKIKIAKRKKLRIYDEIEENEMFIKNSNNKIKKIKFDSIKQLIYTNQNIPKNWQTQKNYQNEVYEIFQKNPKFLQYVGNGYKNHQEPKYSLDEKGKQHNNHYLTNENNKNNYNDNTNLLNNKMKNKIQILSLSPISENPIHKNKNKYKYTNTTPNKNNFIINKNNTIKSKEMLNIFDELDMEYPIKEKINELFPKEEIEKINNTYRNYHPIINERKRKQVFKNNICLNLISSYKEKKSNNKKMIFNGNKFDKNKNLLKMKKQMIKNPLVLKNLEKINFYGPHYSFCSQCGIKNYDFYNKLPIKQLINITNEIKKYRNII